MKIHSKGSDELMLSTLKAVKNVLKKEEPPEINQELKNFYTYTKLLDKKRGNDFKTTFPELKDARN